MKFSSFRGTLCKLAGVAALALSSNAAMANHLPGFDFAAANFTINPSAIGEAGCGGSTCTARYIDFSYSAEVDQSNSTMASAVFTETGGGFFGTFRTELGGAPIDGTGLGNNYRMYFLFDAAGTTAPNAGGAGVKGTFNEFNYTIYIDRDMNTSLTALTAANVGGANDTVTRSNFADDVAVLQGTLVPGLGGFHIFSGLANGDFDVIATATTLNGFFGGDAFVDGQGTADINGVNTRIFGLDEANPFGDAQDIIIIGSGNTSFIPVPEPGSVALFGLALAGLAASRRNKKA